jgi:hypothetical protein
MGFATPTLLQKPFFYQATRARPGYSARPLIGEGIVFANRAATVSGPFLYCATFEDLIGRVDGQLRELVEDRGRVWRLLGIPLDNVAVGWAAGAQFGIFLLNTISGFRREEVAARPLGKAGKPDFDGEFFIFMVQAQLEAPSGMKPIGQG